MYHGHLYSQALGRFAPFSNPYGGHTATVLEIASGSGQHVGHLARYFSHIRWQPSEFGGGHGAMEERERGRQAPLPVYSSNGHPHVSPWIHAHFPHPFFTSSLAPVFDSIRHYTHGLENVLAPLEIDAAAGAWPAVDGGGEAFAAIYVSNLLHISPFSVTEGLFAGAARVLIPGGGLYVYGPIKVGGEHTAPSNVAFDESLRRQNAAWGVRDAGELERLADAHDLEMLGRQEMPANNLMLVFTKRETFFSKRNRPPAAEASACERRRARERRRLRGAAIEQGAAIDQGAAIEQGECVDAPCDTEAAWHEAWERRLGCWFESRERLVEPLRSCSRALALRLSARFDRLVHTTKASLTKASLVRADDADLAERGCEWIEKIELPEFPIPGGFQFGSPLLPSSLLPWGFQKWQELDGVRPLSRDEQASLQNHRSVKTGVYASIAGAGFALGALLVLALGWFRRGARSRASSPRRHQCHSSSTAH